MAGIFSFAGLRAQTVGSKVSFTAVDGKPYTGIVKEIQGNQYKIKYDGFDFEAWLTNEQFTVASNATSAVSTLPGQNSKSNAKLNKGQDVETIFDFGRKQGWASPLQEKKLNDYLARLTQNDRNVFTSFLNQAKTSSAKFFVLKSLLNGDNYEILQTFIEQLNQYPESYQQEKCLITKRRSIIQQWENTCSVTTVQTFLADLCPRYAWDIKQINNFDAVANDPNHPMAQQQKMLLEKYGATPTPRGDYSGKVIPINDALDEFVSRVLGVHFYTQQVTESLPSVFSKIRSQLDRGIDVPLLVGFVGTQARHFLLTMNYRRSANGYQYLIYDPWDGICDYVNESDILQGSLFPLLSQYKISIDYYYPTTE